MGEIISIGGNLIAKKLAIVIFSCLIVLVACTQGECEQKGVNPDPKLLVIGLIPEQNIFKQIERYTPLAEYLSGKIGMTIKLKVLIRYGNIIDNFVSTRMDGAFFGSFTYVMAHKKIGVQVLARPEGLNGSSAYHGLIFVRKDSGIKDITGMKRKRFAFVDKATTAGYLLPLAYFQEQGLKDYKTYFKETYFTGTHEDVIYDVLNKKADIGAAKNTVFERLAGIDERLNRELKILAISPDVPENGLALKKSIAPSVRIALQEALLNMHRDPAGQTVLKNFGAQRFIMTTNKDYEPVFHYAREIGLDFAGYDYANE